MEKKTTDTIKLGAFVISGLSVLIILLYMIGKNRNLFGSNLIIKARFENVQGLKSGNNVRFGGIDIGTVDNINFVDDSTLEVNMRIENSMRNIIKKNAIVSIGTDGLLEGEIVEFKHLDELKKAKRSQVEGKIVFLNQPMNEQQINTFKAYG